MEVSRRNYLAATGGALLAASALSLPAEAEEGKNGGDTLYGHGLVWNRDLPGVAGDLKLSFDLRVNLQTGTGLGTAGDPVHPDWNIHFRIDTVEKEKRPRGEVRFDMRGVVTGANNPANVGLPVRILAETVGDTTAVAIRLGDLAFAGAGLVVVASVTTLVDLLVRIIFRS
jgi:hypothetical protein